MAVRPEMKSNPILQQMTFLPPAEGLHYVLSELEAGREPVEKVFMAWDYFKLFYPVENNTPTEAERLAEKRQAEERPAQGARAESKSGGLVSASISGAVSWPEPPVAYRMERWEGEMVRADAPADLPFTPAGNAILYGKNQDAENLRAALERRGCKVLMLAEGTDPAPLLAAMEEFWKEGPAPHLFIMAGRTNIGQPLTAENGPRRRQEMYMTTSWICRLWLRLLTQDQLLASATVAAATAQGGGFGFSIGGKAPVTSAAAPDGALIAGILKTIYMENGLPGSDGVTVRILDAPDETDPALVAETLLAELKREDVGLERAVVDGRRYVVRLCSVPARSYPATPGPHGGVWVVTGGGRGISAKAAEALARRFGMSVHLLGTSPAPNLPDEVAGYSDAEMAAYKKRVIRDGMQKGLSPEKAWGPIRKAVEIERNLRSMREAGIRVTYHPCDVLNFARTAAVLEEIRRTDGPITGLLHGAGVDGIPATVRDIQEAQFAEDEKLTAIKTDAALNLWKCLADDPLEYFIAFGSISGRFGSASASSYCSANDALCKMMASFRLQRPNVHSFAFHWHAWDEIGMMMRPVSYGSIKILKMELMPPFEGTGHLIDEILAGGPVSETVVTDRHYFSMFYAPSMEKTSGSGDTNQTSGAEGAASPLIDRVSGQKEGALTAEAVFQPASDPFLLDHQLRGRPLLPAVISAEAFCEAVQAAVPNERIAAVRDLTFKDGLVFAGTEPKRVKIAVERSGERLWNARLCADFYNSKGKLILAGRVYSEARIETAPGGDSVRIAPETVADMTLAPSETKGAEWNRIEYLPQGAAMYHGPVFQQLSRCAFFDRPEGLMSLGELTVLSVSDFSKGRSGHWILPASTVDACLYACGVSVWYRTGGKIGLPKSLGLLRLGERLPDEGEVCRLICRSVSHVDRGQSGEEVFRFVLYGADGTPLLTGDNYVCQTLTQ